MPSTNSAEPGSSSLKRYLFTAMLGACLLTFVVIFLVTSLAYHRGCARHARRLTQGISAQVTTSLLQLMERGWSRRELLAFIEPLARAQDEVPIEVALYRAAPVIAEYGTSADRLADEVVRRTLVAGVSRTLESGDRVREVVAVRAEAACLGCHVKASVGDVLGVLDISQNLAPGNAAIRRRLLLTFSSLTPIPLLLAFVVSRRLTQRVGMANTRLRDAIAKVNSVNDLATLELTATRTDFVEINRILAEFNDFSLKMREVAIDKELLAFEVNLLETFIITSEVVKDWRDHVAKLLNQVNTIMDAYVLFSIFDAGNEAYDLEIFWRGRPSPRTRHYFDQVVSQRLAEHRSLRPLAAIKTRHNIVNPDDPEMTIPEAELDLQTKSIFMDNPQIGGVVGLGVHSELKADEGRALIVESILSTLINVIGSVKAIYNYTKELEYYATRDPLTHLYNQRVFWDLAENELQRSRGHGGGFGILIVDLDNFKMINDRYGHAFGDTFLQLLAERLKADLQAGDILTRYGGDEFAVILPDADAGKTYDAALAAIETVKGATAAAPDGKTIRVTVSIGLASFPEHTSELGTLFTIANNMMYKAKTEGKNRIGVPSREDIVQVLKATEEKNLFLLNVLEHRDKIVPFFQPIMRMADGSMEMHELLMGIEHEGTILPASQFVEMAENMGIISLLDYINIEKAFAEIRKRSYPGLLFVNISPKSLILSEFIGKIRNFASEYGIAPERIVFEITERETVKNPALLDKFVKELKLEGFKFAIDDFGAGFSTFHYLKMFPVDYIKIEGEFIRNAPRNPTDRAFVKCIVALARDLRIQTVAEMIEDVDILDTVRELGADFAQGYHIQEPRRELR